MKARLDDVGVEAPGRDQLHLLDLRWHSATITFRIQGSSVLKDRVRVAMLYDRQHLRVCQCRHGLLQRSDSPLLQLGLCRTNVLTPAQAGRRSQACISQQKAAHAYLVVEQLCCVSIGQTNLLGDLREGPAQVACVSCCQVYHRLFTQASTDASMNLLATRPLCGKELIDKLRLAFVWQTWDVGDACCLRVVVTAHDCCDTHSQRSSRHDHDWPIGSRVLRMDSQGCAMLLAS